MLGLEGARAGHETELLVLQSLPWAFILCTDALLITQPNTVQQEHKPLEASACGGHIHMEVVLHKIRQQRTQIALQKCFIMRGKSVLLHG